MSASGVCTRGGANPPVGARSWPGPSCSTIAAPVPSPRPGAKCLPLRTGDGGQTGVPTVVQRDQQVADLDMPRGSRPLVGSPRISSPGRAQQAAAARALGAFPSYYALTGTGVDAAQPTRSSTLLLHPQLASGPHPRGRGPARQQAQFVRPGQVPVPPGTLDRAPTPHSTLGLRPPSSAANPGRGCRPRSRDRPSAPDHRRLAGTVRASRQYRSPLAAPSKRDPSTATSCPYRLSARWSGSPGCSVGELSSAKLLM